jgi:uncharacterized protein (DUF433 family)
VLDDLDVAVLPRRLVTSMPRPASQTLLALRRAYRRTMLEWSECPAVERVPGKVSGAWLFKGTRVPVTALFENLESGARVDDFLEWFPGVTREQVEAVLEHAERSLAVA